MWANRSPVGYWRWNLTSLSPGDCTERATTTPSAVTIGPRGVSNWRIRARVLPASAASSSVRLTCQKLSAANSTTYSAIRTAAS
jgi:hypothetical protein